MREPRNPFRMRIAENIESDFTFLRLFNPEILDVLPYKSEELWKGIKIIRSSPGGGKTSLLRSFTTGSLRTLCDHRLSEELKELYEKMKGLNIVNDEGPNVMAIMISCARNYATLDNLEISSVQRERLFFSLLNSRIILAMIKSVLAHQSMRYPDEIEKIRFVSDRFIEQPFNLEHSCGGRQLYDWAMHLEKSICYAIDSFAPEEVIDLKGHDAILSVKLLESLSIFIDGKQINTNLLIMLDDVHTLATNQRTKLFSTIAESRPSIGVWIAERFEALAPNELLSSGINVGREFETSPINLEDFWRNSQRRLRFSRAAIDIAERRSRLAREVLTLSFDSGIENELNVTRLKEELKSINDSLSTNLLNLSTNPRYREWINSSLNKYNKLPSMECAIKLRGLIVLIERDLRKKQLTLDLPMTEEYFESTEDSDVDNVAKLFLAKEYLLPYYFGVDKLTQIASSNIEQYLAFSGEFFEEMISASLLRKGTIISAHRQEKILKEICKLRWDDIPRKVSNGREVQRFLEACAQMAQWETYKPNAPYSPGVTGIAFSMKERDLLVNDKSNKYKMLRNILASCISNNLLDANIDKAQGQPGKKWMKLYFNRWLCVHFDLHLNYGGWRAKRIDEFQSWAYNGYKHKNSQHHL